MINSYFNSASQWTVFWIVNLIGYKIIYGNPVALHFLPPPCIRIPRDFCPSLYMMNTFVPFLSISP